MLRSAFLLNSRFGIDAKIDLVYVFKKLHKQEHYNNAFDLIEK